MDAITIIGIIGAIASIYGAYIAIQAKNNAKSSADIAETAKNKIINKQKTTEIGEILYHSKRVQQTFGKYSIAQSNKSLAGVEFKNDAVVLQDYIFSFNENRGILEDHSSIDTNGTYQELNRLLDKFSNATSADEKKDYGKQIRLITDDIIFKLRKVIDKRNSDLE